MDLTLSVGTEHFTYIHIIVIYLKGMSQKHMTLFTKARMLDFLITRNIYVLNFTKTSIVRDARKQAWRKWEGRGDSLISGHHIINAITIIFRRLKNSNDFEKINNIRSKHESIH